MTDPRRVIGRDAAFPPRFVGSAVDPGEPLSPVCPWPTTTAAIAAAVEILRSDCGLGARTTDAEIGRLGATAAALVERDAPDAPGAICTEAMIRFVGYLSNTARSQGIVKSSLGPKSSDYITNHAPAFRMCGAKALLAPWKIRRAGVI